jgi:mycothiol synthase
MKLTMYSCRDEDDYWRIRAFLRDVFLSNDRKEVAWQAARLDYWRWHGVENLHEYPSLDVSVFVWETVDGRIRAVLNPEGTGVAHLQVHPAARTADLLEEMIGVAEERLARPGPDGKRKLQVWCNEHDDLCQRILARRGYAKGDWPEYQRRRSLDEPIPKVALAPGYTVRPLGGAEELPARSWVSWRAFHPDEPDGAYGGYDWYHNIQRMPLYRRDLDIVAVAPGGELAAFCTIWYDDVTRTGYVEPVGTAPEHRRRGLGKAVMYEALRRLRSMGATLACVGSYSPAAHALYASVGFTEYELSEPWVKKL